MSVKIIPEKKIYICDKCKKEFQNELPVQIYLKKSIVDFQGFAVGARDVSKDFCEPCGDVIIQAINNA